MCRGNIRRTWENLTSHSRVDIPRTWENFEEKSWVLSSATPNNEA